MEFLESIWSGTWGYVIPFLVLLTVLVFVHEMGHYLVARYCDVKVEVFSIGFGPEIFGFTNAAGTRWKISAVPLGGYVKMYGETAPETRPGSREKLSEDQLAVSFHHKTLRQRSAIVFAGPLANYVFAVVLLAGALVFLGEPFTPTDVGKVSPGSAAEKAGFQAGDVIKRIDGSKIDSFHDIQRIVRLSPGVPLAVVVDRNGAPVTLAVTPDIIDEPDRFGNPQRFGRLGIQRTTADIKVVYHDPFTALWRASVKSVQMTGDIFKTLGQIVTGRRTFKEIGGPIRIAKITGDVATLGFDGLLSLAVILSINLCLINLFPIPMLDGGHLMFYAFEAIRGRPLGEAAQEYGFRIGIALVLALMVFVTLNDLIQLRVIDFFVNLVT